MSYKITITEVKTVTKLVRGRWERLSAAPDSEYGYAPDREEEVEVKRDVLSQEVETLDLSAVIKAINGL